MYGVSNGGLGGNGRAGANSQGQGMLARAADKGREKRRSSIGMIPPGATSSSILAGTKRKAGNIIFSSPPSSSHGTSGLPPASDQSPTLKRVGNRTTIGPNTNSNGSSSPYPVRIVKMVSATSSASKVPPGGLDFFGTCNTAGARGTPARNGSKVAQNSQHKLTSMNARLGSASTAKVKTKLTAATRTNGSASDAPAMVAGEDVPASKKQKRSAPRAVKEAGDGSDSCQKRVAVRGAVD
ncbi:hypothetical protein OC846_005498 [Tilletia horrida]|uniref:Uncharacterized protein n=1 Tax=Tilletia horrida TaxID=155126 RepID=A0AAN6GKP2_9BASI|nr:hypothetical protein OC846_005498 [Tilletia horrida]